MKKQLCFFLPSMLRGGAEKVASQLGIALDEYDKTFLLLENRIEFPVEGRVEIIGIGNSKAHGAFGKLYKFIAVLLKTKGAKKRLHDGICLSFMPLQNLINAETKGREKTILSVRSFESRDLKGPFFPIYRMLIGRLYKKADAIVAVSQGVARDLVENFGVPEHRVRVIYNPVNLQDILEKSRENLGRFEPIFRFPTVTNVANFGPAKGHPFLLRIFSRLKDRIPNAKLLFVGSGSRKTALADMAGTLGLRYFDASTESEMPDPEAFDLFLLGEQANPYKFIAHSTLFVLPSVWEGFPNVLLEAMACKTPIVSADCQSGPRELLAPGSDFRATACEAEQTENGILLPPFGAQEPAAEDPLSEEEALWVATLGRLLDAPEAAKPMADAAYKRVQAFRTEGIVAQWRALFDEIDPKIVVGEGER